MLDPPFDVDSLSTGSVSSRSPTNHMPIKRFLQWIGLKETLHGQNHRAPLVSEGEIWWVSLGENIGSEINGKSNLFSRPVIIYQKLAHGFYFVIPTTSQHKTGSWFIGFRHHGKSMTACLHQARAIDYRRLSSRMGMLDDGDLLTVRAGFAHFYVKKFPAIADGAAGKSRM